MKKLAQSDFKHIVKTAIDYHNKSTEYHTGTIEIFEKGYEVKIEIRGKCIP